MRRELRELGADAILVEEREGGAQLAVDRRGQRRGIQPLRAVDDTCRSARIGENTAPPTIRPSSTSTPEPASQPRRRRRARRGEPLDLGALLALAAALGGREVCAGGSGARWLRDLLAGRLARAAGFAGRSSTRGAGRDGAGLGASWRAERAAGACWPRSNPSGRFTRSGYESAPRVRGGHAAARLTFRTCAPGAIRVPRAAAARAGTRFRS